MDVFEKSKNYVNMLILFSGSSTAISLHCFSASAHLFMLLALCISWARKKSMPTHENLKPMVKNTRFLYYWTILISCMGLSSYDLLLCVLNYLSGYRQGWSDLKVFAQLDLVFRTLTWFVISAYLHIQFSHSNERKFPSLLRIWWATYFLMSCSYLALHLGLYWKNVSAHFMLWLSDGIYTIVGLLICNVGFFSEAIEGQYVHLLEPFLKRNSSRRNGDNGEKLTVNEDSVTPYTNANIFSIFTFSWMGPLFALGYKKTLDLEDVPQLDYCDRASVVFAHFRKNLEFDHSIGNGGQVSISKLAKALILSTWKDILWTALFSIICTIASYVGPYLIDAFVLYLNSDHHTKHKGYTLVLIFLLSKLIRCLSERHLYFQLRKMSIRVRAALFATIYDKGLRLSSQSKQGHGSGKNVNLMSVDVERTSLFSWYLHTIWRVPVQIVLALLILYKSIGLASLVAFVSTLILLLSNVPLGKLQERLQGELMASKDQRMKVTSEALRNMRVLKVQGWDMRFLSQIIELRNIETKRLRKLLYSMAMIGFIYLSAPMFVSMVTFGFCMLMRIPLESGKILSALVIFEMLQESIYILPDLISVVIQTKVSLGRIASFLCLDDLDPNTVQKLPTNSLEFAIEIVKGNFSWDSQSSYPTLKDINFRVRHGMRVAICGFVGSGKSSLLSCLLGEMLKVSGETKLSGTKAYVTQSPWIQSDKIVDNILFGKEMDKERYNIILDACALKKDLELFKFGDQTIIGERGVNLSGGQKQRIQIARALYHDADIYLLDDPFSAVDVHTSTHLFKECLLRILGSKTVIYVTHQVEFLSSADLILVMRDGRITQAGKYEEIYKLGTDFMELVGSHNKALSSSSFVKRDAALNDLIIGEEDSNILSRQKLTQNDEEREPKNCNTEKSIQSEEQIVKEEKREKGEVDILVYWKYISAVCKGAFVPFILLAQILFQVLFITSSYWMVLNTPVSKNVTPYVKGSTLIFVYAALTLGSSLCVLIRSILIATVGYKTATLFFKKMHLCIFRAPISFFDSTPSERILNRASMDQNALDTSIPNQIEELLMSLIRFLGTVAVMSHVEWKMPLVFIPMAITCIWCFDQEETFMDKNFKLVDVFLRPKFHFSSAMEWLCFRMDILASITYAIFLAFLISMPNGVLSPGIAGLAVTYGLSFSMHGVIWDLTVLENKIISVERILQYANIPSEPSLSVEENQRSHEWPSEGKVHIVDLQVRYAPYLPFVLRGITCTFPGGMKIGIVGRTGSGKSTLVQAIFRMLEPTTGQIWIDDIDISKMGLHDLRSKLSIIPQDPTMFEGTLRRNIDPLGEYTDEQIWQVLSKCQLSDEIMKKEGKLDSIVAENGENWSIGHRQLVCLGRVLLKRSKILVLDEATASVDTTTDYLIQKTLHQHFSSSTIITIAHRITSVIDLDLVLVLNNGLIVEYDSPIKLLEAETSEFAKLVKEYTQRFNS